MERSYWLRFATIIALALSCVYVLLPTLLANDKVDLSGTTSAFTIEREGPLEAWFVADGAEPESAWVDWTRARLDAARTTVERVAAEDGRIEVTLRPGTSKAAIDRLVTASGSVALYPPSAFDGFDPASSDVAAVELALAGKAPAAGVGPLGLAWDGATVQDGIVRPREAASAAPPSTVVVLDGAAVGVVRAAEAGAVVELLGSAEAKAVTTALLTTAAAPVALTRYQPPRVEAAAPKEEAVVVDQAWYAAMLPNTRINLGLDLQGGIDLTLQVDQEEAVYAQVQRDRDALRDQALRDQVTMTVTRERSRPALRFVYEGEFAKLKDYLSTALRDYRYVESLQTQTGSEHIWEMIPERITSIQTSAVEQVLETLRKRVDSTGVKEPSIVQMGGGRINIQLPGMSDPQAALDAIGTQAVLEFRLVDAEFGESQITELEAQARGGLPDEQFEDDDLVNDWLREQKLLSEDRLLLWQYDETPADGLARGRAIIVYDQVILTGGDINNAGVSWDQNNMPMVLLDFKPAGAAVFCDVTTNNVRKQFAIILDGQVRSAPSIREPICGGRASIDMSSSADGTQEANTLALVLRTGSLTAPVDPGEIRHIGPSLGADAIQSGIVGSIVGGMLTVLSMVLWYRTAGVVAVFALALNVLMVFSMLAMFGATLTLPGIAGVALTIGMAVDANIIVYERIREELALGVSARKAVDVGYEKGVTAVIDANLTTGIAGIVLYSYGTGPIRGFAVTLLIGIITTIITGVFVTRTLMEMITRSSNSRLAI